MIGPRLSGKRWWLACSGVFACALAITAPTVGDFGLTYDEPAYRFSQQYAIQWWEKLASARSMTDLRELVDSETLLHDWPYARHGINFHPPFAGQLNLLTYSVFGSALKDIPARRMASALELCVTVTALFGFLASRYGASVGLVAAGSLLFMPRVYGQAHLIDTDTPGMMAWALAAFSFWKGLHEPNARRWRVLLGVLLGIAFVTKMGAVMVLLPIACWLALAALTRPHSKAAWIDGVLTIGAMLVPLAFAFLEIRRLDAAFLDIQSQQGIPRALRTPARTNLFYDHPSTNIPGAILAIPLAIWIIREVLRKIAKASSVLGAERPALDTLAAILAFAPVVAWVGNPAWWRESLPRLAHYYSISTARRGVLPDIQILYFGQGYEYRLPWPNGWVLVAITVPIAILAASILGLVFGIRIGRADRLPAYFFLHFLTLPLVRMFPTPAHDGVRLMLPAFVFLAAFAGWGAIGFADIAARIARVRSNRAARLAAILLVLGPSAWSLARIHPFELSYYNTLIGGPRGAWKAGFELSYWYDAFDPVALEEINRRLPQGATVDFLNEKSNPLMILTDLQSVGALRGDIKPISRNLPEFAYAWRVGQAREGFPYVWLLTHDSKASAFTRLLFAMTPWYELRPRQLDSLRVATVADPRAVSRAWALWLLLDAGAPRRAEPQHAPRWVREHAPFLSWLWFDGLKRVPQLAINEPMLEWARTDPNGLRTAAKSLAADPNGTAPEALRLRAQLNRYADGFAAQALLEIRPEALNEAVEILIHRAGDVRAIVLHQSYVDPTDVGGYLDRDLVTTRRR